MTTRLAYPTVYAVMGTNSVRMGLMKMPPTASSAHWSRVTVTHSGMRPTNGPTHSAVSTSIQIDPYVQQSVTVGLICVSDLR